MMYASKIPVNRKPKKIQYTREVELPDRWLTVEDIAKHLNEGEKFSIHVEDSPPFGERIFIIIHGFRDETKEETEARVASEILYNENYDKFHAKYGDKRRKTP